jgi:hypothetical protein
MSKKAEDDSMTQTVTKGRTYFPSKSFDDDLVALVDLYEKNGWSFSGVDLDQLRNDSRLQRDERLAYDAAEAVWLKVKREFGVRTESRYLRYASALDTPRGAFRHNKGVTAQLDKFRRPRAKRSPKIDTVVILASKDD